MRLPMRRKLARDAQMDDFWETTICVLCYVALAIVQLG